MMKLRLIAEMGELGHTALDAAGLVPGIGEIADLTNAKAYADEGRYFESVLSLISMVPGIGDVIGKGLKYLGKGGKLPAKFMAKYGDDIARAWPKIKRQIKELEEWREHAEALDDMVVKITQENKADTAQPEMGQEPAPQI